MKDGIAAKVTIQNIGIGRGSLFRDGEWQKLCGWLFGLGWEPHQQTRTTMVS